MTITPFAVSIFWLASMLGHADYHTREQAQRALEVLSLNLDLSPYLDLVDRIDPEVQRRINILESRFPPVSPRGPVAAALTRHCWTSPERSGLPVYVFCSDGTGWWQWPGRQAADHFVWHIKEGEIRWYKWPHMQRYRYESGILKYDEGELHPIKEE